MIDDSGITFDGAVYGQVGAVSSVGNLFVLENAEGGLDSFGSGGPSFEEFHTHFSGARSRRSGGWSRRRNIIKESIRNASLEMNTLILMAVKAGTSMDEYRRGELGLLP